MGVVRLELEIDTMCQLEMTPDMKCWIFKAHEFYVTQIKQRVVAQFQDMEGDADRYAQSEYERLGSQPGWGDEDMASVAEDAHDNAVEYYRLLADLRQSVIIGALAGLYYQWEKQLRDFIQMELTHDTSHDIAAKIAWSRDIANVFSFLGKLGWDVQSEPFFPLIDACRLVVNVYKHGQGSSLAELKSKYPEYIPDPLACLGASNLATHVHHEWLSLTEEQFTHIADGLKTFWEKFPERLRMQE